MCGDIYFGFDRIKPVGQWLNDGYVDTPTFSAFEDLLDAALEQSRSGKLAEIKESEVQMIYIGIVLSGPSSATLRALLK